MVTTKQKPMVNTQRMKRRIITRQLKRKSSNHKGREQERRKKQSNHKNS